MACRRTWRTRLLMITRSSPTCAYNDQVVTGIGACTWPLLAMEPVPACARKYVRTYLAKYRFSAVAPYRVHLFTKLCLRFMPDLHVHTMQCSLLVSRRKRIHPAGHRLAGAEWHHIINILQQSEKNGNESTCVGPRLGVLPQLGECLRGLFTGALFVWRLPTL